MPVYLIAAGDTGMVKIGKADNPTKRLADLQCAHFETLRIIRQEPGSYSAETWLHRHYAHLWVANEWYRFCPSMLTIEVPPDGGIGGGIIPERRMRSLKGWAAIKADPARVKAFSDALRRPRHRPSPTPAPAVAT